MEQKDYLSLLQEKKMTLIMSLPANDPEMARAAWENGADVVKVHINVQHRASKTEFRSFAQEEKVLREILRQAIGPCGIVAGGDGESASRDYPAIKEAGFSFVSLYTQHMRAPVLLDNTLYKMAALSADYSLRQVQALPTVGADVLEASIMHPESYGQPLSAKEFLEYYSICETSSIPVVVPTQRFVTCEDVEILRRCGVAGLMLGAVVTGKTAQSIGRTVAHFRKAIDALI